MNTAIFVDTFTRELQISTVAVSEVKGKGLVLRYGAEIGPLWQIMESSYNGVFQNNDLPVIVATRGYSAKSSAGFVEVKADHMGENWQSRLRTHVVGVQGMPWMQKKSLRLCGNPMEVLVLRPGTKIGKLQTSDNSNRNSADAALKAVSMKASVFPRSVFIAEGQSDYVKAWELNTNVGERNHFLPEEIPFSPAFQEEFRSDRFTDEAFVATALRSHASRNANTDNEEGRQEKIEAVRFIYLNLLMADDSKFWENGKGWKEQLLPWFTQNLVGDRLTDVVKTLADKMRTEKGWKLSIGMEVGNHWLQAMNSEGKVVANGWGACHGPKQYEQNLIGLADGLDEENRKKLLEQLENQPDEDRGWMSHIAA